jgi:hypothetical protein
MNVLVTRDGSANITGAISRFRDIVWGVNLYIENKVPHRTVYVDQMIFIPPMDSTGWPPGGWTQVRPKPRWVSMDSTYPSVAFLYNALSKGQGLVICWNQANLNGDIISGASHLLTVTGLTWDSSAKKGTLYYIDPSVGTPYNSSLWQAANGVLWMDYGETDGIPWKQLDGETNWWYSGNVRISLAMSAGPVPTPLPSIWLLLGSDP